MALLVLLMLTAVALMNAPARVEAWGQDGHAIICEVAEAYLDKKAADAVANLLPNAANGNMSSECSWADQVRYTAKYRWSAPLHFIDTPDQACDYDYTRDCVSSSGKADFCSAGAIKNYTSQLTGTASGNYNLTEALLFLIHFVGDIHQPLHCGFIGDVGGNTISVKWYSTSTNLHHVWDTSIITSTYDDYFNSQAGDLAASIVSNITTSQVKEWSACPSGTPPCVDTYANESVALACSEAYADVNNGHVSDGETLSDAYFSSRYPVVENRLAMAGVRLASILNTIFA